MLFLPLISGSLPSWPLTSHAIASLLLYGGPETVMPLTSALAAIIGVLLLFGRRVVEFVHTLIQPLYRKTSERNHFK